MSSLFQFGAARKLYRDGNHPRIMLGPDDIEMLRERVSRGHGKKIMINLRKKLLPLTDAVLDANDLETVVRGDDTWNAMGARLGFAMTDLAFVALLDGNEEIVEAINRIMRIVCKRGYDTHRTGVRPPSMTAAFDLLYHQLGEAEKKSYIRAGLKDLKEILKYRKFTHYRASAMNMVLGQAYTGIVYCLALQGEPGVPDLGDALRQLLKRFEATVFTSVGPDGYPEEDIGYGTGVTAGTAIVGEWIRRAGLFDIYKECPHFLKFGRAMVRFVQPWGENLSNTGDHGDDFGNREFVLARLAAETNDPSLLWLLGTLYYSHGVVHPENDMPSFYQEVPLRKGFRTPASYLSILVADELCGAKHPGQQKLKTQYMDRRRGIVSFRSGWGEDETFVVFDGSQRSPSCCGHGHASGGHFSLSAVGEYFSIDTGRYMNEQDQHSVVLIEGKSGRSTNGEWIQVFHDALLTDYREGELCDFAAVDSSHQHNCYFARRYLGLVKGNGVPGYAWTIDDINKDYEFTEFWWQMQTAPENEIKLKKRSATVKGFRHGNFLDTHFVLMSSRGYEKQFTLKLEQDIITCSSHKYIKDTKSKVSTFPRPSDMVHGPVYERPRLLAKVGGRVGRFMSIMLPRKKGAKPAKVKQIPTVENSIGVQVTHENIEDTIIFAYEHQLLETKGIHGRGQWCVVRRKRESGKLISWELGNGISLKIDDRERVR